MSRTALSPVLAMLCVAPLLQAATFGQSDPIEDKAELIAKLSSDINKVDHSIEVTKDLIKTSPDAPYLADLYFRLAELYVERSRYVYARVMEQRPEGETTVSGETALEVKITKGLAIETYGRILSEFPEFDKNDQVRFFRAHEYREMGEFETMLKEYQELINKHPSSEWAIEARLILGDHHFDKSDLPNAEKYYSEILSLPESHLHDMARYKLGWIRINQERFSDSLALFERAVTSARKNKKGAVGDARSLDVKREALLAMVWPFSEVKKAYQAPDYFRKLADSKTIYVSVLNRLANRYFVKTEYSNAALLYREIVPISSDIQQNTEYISRIYESIRNMSKRNPRRYAHASDDVDNIVKTVARFQTHWSFSEEDKSKLTHDFEIRARDLATRLHDQAQKKSDVRSARVAADAYRKYLSLFLNEKEVQEMRLNRASALFQAKDYLNAGLEHELIARALEDGPKRRESLYQAILAFYKSLEEDGKYREQNPTSDGLLNKLDLLQAREGLKQLGAYYVKVWPKDKNTADVKFNVARMYYDQGDYERSKELFAAFVKQYPTHKDVAIAGNLALDALSKMDDYDGLAALAKEFVANGAITDSKFKAEAAKVGEAARKRNVEIAVINTTEGDFGETMLNEWEKHQDSAEGEDFLYTAFVKYKNDANVAGVFDFGGRMIGAYPDSKRLVDVFGTMGNFALRAADFERAAFLFEEYYKRFPGEGNAKDILLAAADLRYFLGDYDRAAEDFRRMRAEGGPQQKVQAHQRLMDIYRDARDWSQLARVAQTALADNNRWMGAAFHLGLAYLGENKQGLAQKELTRAAQMKPQTNFDQRWAGRAYYELGRLLHQQFEQIQFTDAASAEQVLPVKLQYLEGAGQAYVAAVQSGDSRWAIAALQSVARLNRDFANFLSNAPVPDGMSPADQQAYKTALQGEAAPYAQEAENTLKVCQQKSEQLKVFTRTAKACLDGTMEKVDELSKPRRTAVTGDEAYQKELASLRQQLAKKPGNLESLQQLIRRAISVGDFHLAKLTLDKAIEQAPRNAMVHNLMGVVQWSLGEPQLAYESLEKASKANIKAAWLNLASLYQQYGYDKLAKRALSNAGDVTSSDMNSTDVHPSVTELVQEINAS